MARTWFFLKIEQFNRILGMMKRLSNNNHIEVNSSVYDSEKLTGNTNRAMAYYLKGANIIQMDVEDVNRIVKALMMTCGLYDKSGEFCIEVGIPCKSGVGGCIMAIVPNRMEIAVVGPALDVYGNSIGGGKVLEELSKELHLSMF